MSAQGLPCPPPRHGFYDLPCPHGSLESCCLFAGCKVYEYADEILSLLHITVVIRYSLPLANFFSKSVGRRFPLTTAFYFHPLPNSHSAVLPIPFAATPQTSALSTLVLTAVISELTRFYLSPGSTVQVGLQHYSDNITN